MIIYIENMKFPSLFPATTIHYVLNHLIIPVLTVITQIKKNWQIDRGKWEWMREWNCANVQVMEEKQQKYESIMCSLYRFQSFVFIYLPLEQTGNFHNVKILSITGNILFPRYLITGTLVSHSTDVILSKQNVNATFAFSQQSYDVNSWLHLPSTSLYCCQKH